MTRLSFPLVAWAVLATAICASSGVSAQQPPPPPEAEAAASNGSVAQAEAEKKESQKRSKRALNRTPCEEKLQLSTEGRISYENSIYPRVDHQVWPEGVALRFQLPNWTATRENNCKPSRDTQDGLSIGYSVARFSAPEYRKRNKIIDPESVEDLNRPALSIFDLGWFGRVCIYCNDWFGVGAEARMGIAFNSGATVRYELDGQPVNDAARSWGIGPAWGLNLFLALKRFSVGAGMNGSVASGIIGTALSISLTYSGVPDGEDVATAEPEATASK